MEPQNSKTQGCRPHKREVICSGVSTYHVRRSLWRTLPPTPLLLRAQSYSARVAAILWLFTNMSATITSLWSNRAPRRPPRCQAPCHLDSHTRTKLVELRLTAKWAFPQIHREYPNIPLATIKSTVYLHQNRGYINEDCSGRGRKPIFNEEERGRIFVSIHGDPDIVVIVVVQRKIQNTLVI